MVTPPLFQNSMKKFSFAWWAYSFPVTMLALSSASYAKATDTVLAHQIRRVLSMASLFVTLVLLLLSIVFGKAVFFSNSARQRCEQRRTTPMPSPFSTIYLTVYPTPTASPSSTIYASSSTSFA
uniref:Uncharacterized protein n=1 Tax=Nymphaea colorata TaxID=210225 RepID=A0A5K1GL98_9MAGN